MNFVQFAPLLFFVQFSVGYAGYIRAKDLVADKEIRLQNQENFKEKMDCGANNHDVGCATIFKKARRSPHSNHLPWNIDRLDQRHLPLDGEFCPLADGTGVDVYIIGSGINYDHEVFNGRASYGGFDIYGDDGKDCDGHGTHVAGLAVGNPTGVARGANVYSIKIIDCKGDSFVNYATRGIYHVIERVNKTGRRSVITLAFVPNYSIYTPIVKLAVSYNIVIVNNAGAFNNDDCWRPTLYVPGVINVGAIQQAVDNRYPGKHMLMMTTNYGDCIHVFAPGQDVYSASHLSNTKLVSKSGIFAACGIVAGVAATLLQRFPNYTAHQIRDRLIQESTKDVINFHTRNGQNLTSVVAETTPNRLVYTERCINELDTGPPGLKRVKGTGPPGLKRVKGKGKQGDPHRVPRSKEQKGTKKKIINSEKLA